MKKFFVSFMAFAVSTALCVSSALAVKPGGVSYTDAGGNVVSAVRSGENNISLDVVNTSDVQKNVQLISAVYDDLTDALTQVVYSQVESLTPGESKTLDLTLELDTADGYSVKNYIWDSLGGSLVPYASQQSGIINANAEYRPTGEAFVTWTVLETADYSSFSVEKNGEIIKSGLSKYASAYTDADTEDGDVYRIFALNGKGDILCASNETSITVYTPQKPEFSMMESDSVYKYVAANNVDATGDSNTDYSYSSDDMQIGIQRHSKTLDAATKVATIPADAAWTIVEAGPEGDKRAALYTTKYKNSAGADKNGNIVVNLGSAYTTSDAYQNITFTYYDYASSGSVRIRYTTSDKAGGSTHTYKDVAYTGTGKWLKKTVELTGAYFNGDSVVLGGNGDFRFESSGKDIYISELSINNGTIAGAKPARCDTFTVDGSYLESTNSVTWSVRSNGTSIKAEGQETLVDDGDGTFSTASSNDTTYMYVDSIDGKSALMTAKYTRPTGSDSLGFIAFTLDGDKFFPEDNNVVVDVVYNSKYAVPKINHINSFEAATNKLTAITTAASQIIGDGVWKTARFVFNNNILLNKYVNGDCNIFGYTKDASFRLSSTEVMYVNSVTVMTKDYFDKVYTAYENAVKEYNNLTTDYTPNADTLYPDGISVSFADNTPVENGLEFNDTVNDETTASDANFKYTEDGNAVSTRSFTGGNFTESRKRYTYLYFNVSNDYLRGIYDSYAEIEVEYLDDSEYQMELQYFNTDNTLTSLKVKQTGSGLWKKHTYIANNLLCMNDSFDKGCDLRLTLLCNQPTTENPVPAQLKVKSVNIKNISHKKQDSSRIGAVPKVYIASDSIAAAYTNGSRPYGERYGWGEKLNPGVAVVNYAKAGASTRTFASFDEIANRVNKNDYVLICFGHNDSMSNKYVSPEDYKANITAFANKIMNAQAIPVILSPIPTLYNGETDLAPEGGINEYRKAAMEVASELNVPSFDLATAFGNVLDSCADNASKEAYYVPDNETSTRYVHLSEAGAQCIADLVTDALANNSMIRKLKNYIPNN